MDDSGVAHRTDLLSAVEGRLAERADVIRFRTVTSRADRIGESHLYHPDSRFRLQRYYYALVNAPCKVRLTRVADRCASVAPRCTPGTENFVTD